MAIISNFELLFKPLAPQGGPSTEVARVVIQGYFLEISNLEKRDLVLTFRTRTSKRNPGDSVNTEFTDTNNAVAFDITADNNPIPNDFMAFDGELIPGKQLGHFSQSLVLPAGQTASLAVLPNIPNLASDKEFLANPDLAIRGYTELVLVDRDDQRQPAAKVLVSPEHRGTFIDPKFDFLDPNFQTGLDFDQLAYGLPTANGKALQEICIATTKGRPFSKYEFHE